MLDLTIHNHVTVGGPANLAAVSTEITTRVMLGLGDVALASLTFWAGAMRYWGGMLELAAPRSGR